MSLLNLAEKWCPKQCRPILDRISASPIGARIAGGAFWSVFGSGASKAFTLLAIILTARILGKEAFGEFGFIRSTAMTFIAFSGFGVGLTATKYIAELLVTDKDRAGRIIGLSYLFTFASSLVVAAIFYFSVPWLCETQLKSPHLADQMRLGAPLLFLMTMMGTQGGVMAGFQDFRGLAAANFVSSFLSMPLYVAGAYVAGVGGALIGLLCATGLNIGVNSMFIFRNTRKHGVRYAFGEAYKELPVLWKFSLPTLLCSITYSTLFWGCQLILASQPNGNAELGVYFAAADFYALILFAPVNLSPIFLSFLSELRGKKNKTGYRKTVFVHFVANITVTAMLAIPIAVFSKPIMNLFGDGFTDGYRTLCVLCVATIFFVIGQVVDQIVASQDKMWLNFVYSLLGALTMIGICHYLVENDWGSLGLATAILGGALARLMFFIVYKCVYRKRIVW